MQVYLILAVTTADVSAAPLSQSAERIPGGSTAVGMSGSQEEIKYILDRIGQELVQVLIPSLWLSINKRIVIVYWADLALLVPKASDWSCRLQLGTSLLTQYGMRPNIRDGFGPLRPANSTEQM